MRIRPVPHAERRAAPRWTRIGLTIAVAVTGAAAGQVQFLHRGVDDRLGAGVGVLIAVLVVWGFPSLRLRSTARTVVLLSAAIIARFATLDPLPGDGIGTVAFWLVGAIAVFVITDRISTAAAPEAPSDLTAEERRTRGRGQMIGSLGTIAVLSALAVLAVVLIAPFANDRFAAPSDAGAPAAGSPDSARTSLRRSDRLDMTTRPDLTDEILLTVRSDRRSFLRGQVYDHWDGTTWTNTATDRFRLAGDNIHSDEHDLGAVGPITFEQRIRLEADWADLYLAAPTAVRLDSRNGAVQTLDGTLAASPEPLGRGAVYTVTSRTHRLDAAGLRAADGPTPSEIEERYVVPPQTSERVVDLARQIIADTGAMSTYDRIRAFEAWMGDNLEYSLDAPPSPAGVDAVDQFLFEDRLGWCEQIASSLVVLARSEGIPARLATGFVASERDRLSGDLVVRAKDAHAWAEVWFPDHGWVPFDPTADVPLAPEPDDSGSLADLLREHLGLIAAVVIALTALGWGAGRLSRRIRNRPGRQRPATTVGRLDHRLTELGRRHGISREISESAGAHADRIGSALGHPEITEVGRVIDDQLYAFEPPSAPRIDAAIGLLDRIEADPTDAAVDDGPKPPR